MAQQLDLDNWPRKQHYQFFKTFDEPFFGITVQVDMTAAYQHCKQQGYSFFQYYLYQTLRAANATEPFRYRIRGEQVYILDQISASATINRADGTFGFSYIPFQDSYPAFVREAQSEIARIQNSHGLDPGVAGDDVIHFSSLPWLNFTSLSHARSFKFPDSCTKISFGKMSDQNGSLHMPISIHVHHALMDGLHVANMVETLQKFLQEPEKA